MTPNRFQNGVTLQEFFPLIAKLGQQIRMPVVVLDLKTIGSGSCTEVGIEQCSAITIGQSGSVTEYSSKVSPDLKLLMADANDFRSIYDSLSRAFTTSLVVGCNTALYDIPAIYGNMLRYGLPIISARTQLDITDIWQQPVSGEDGLKRMAEHYGVEVGKSHLVSRNAITSARILEAMLWRHGSETVLKHLQCSLSSYLTPDQVTGSADPIRASTATPGKRSSQAPGGDRQSAGSLTTPGSTRPNQGAGTAMRASQAAKLKAAVSNVVSQSGTIRDGQLAKIAELMEWSESKTSIEVGRLLTQGRIDSAPFIIDMQQKLLALHLPDALKGMTQIKLKPVREAIMAKTGHDVSYIQIRLGLKAMGVRVE